LQYERIGCEQTNRAAPAAFLKCLEHPPRPNIEEAWLDLERWATRLTAAGPLWLKSGHVRCN
jgi:hypothetical protein